MNTWVVKCRHEFRNGEIGWHWDRYFDGPDDETDCDFSFGGSGWIRSPLSKKFLREQVKSGDVVICYQTDQKSILGITRMATDGLEEDKGSGDFNSFHLYPAKEAVRIDPPLKIEDLRAEGCNPKCFGPGTQGTLFRVMPKELAGIMKVTENHRSGTTLPAWLPEARSRGLTGGIHEGGKPPRKGGGFGTSEQNKEVEDAAIDFVTWRYRRNGWKVKSVEAENCGYDLLCTRGKTKRHVEVKGVSGGTPSFIITAGELKNVRQDPLAYVCVVVNALLPSRSCTEMTAKQLLAKYRFSATQYRASPVTRG